jgi:hypothetical protein
MSDFTMYQGDSKTLQVTVLTEAGGPADLAGAAIRWQLATKIKGPAIVEKAIGSGITLVDAAAGRFDVALDPPDTEPLTGVHYYEAEVVNLAIVSTVLTGSVEIKPTLIKPGA